MKALINYTTSLFFDKKNQDFEPDLYYNKDTTLYDLITLLNGYQQNHLTEYVYYGTTDLYNDLLVYNKNYYLYYDEVEIIQNNIDAIKRAIGDIEYVVEVGPGSNSSLVSKTMPILNALGSLKQYWGVDISESYAKKAAAVIKEHLPNIDVAPVQMNFYNLDKNILNLTKPKCVLFLGSTIGNIADEKLEEVFKNFVDFLNIGDYLIMTFDVNHDHESLLSAYDNFYLKRLVKNGFYAICDILKIDGLDLNQLSIECKWDKACQSIRYSICSAKNQEFYVNSIKLTIPKNKNFSIVSSKKFSDGEIGRLFSRGKVKSVAILTNSARRVKVYVFQKQAT